MRISLKTIVVLWIGLFLIIGGLLFNAYSKLKPATFVALITEQVQKNYPGSKLEVGKIDYRFSLDFNLNLQNIQLRRAGKLLGSLGKLELKVPWWLLLVNRGNAQINLSKLDIYIDHEQSHEINVHGRIKAPEIKVELPSYLLDARFTLRAKDVSIKDIHNSRRYFNVSKLLVREFQYGKNSAFELNIPIAITHGEVRYTSDLWLFGDVTPETEKWNFHYRGEFKTKEVSDKFQIEDLSIAGSAIFKPQVLDIVSSVDLLIEQKSVGKGSLNATQENLAINFDFIDIPLSYLGFIYEEIQNPYLHKLDGHGKGAVKLNKKFSSDAATVDGKLTFDGNFELSSQDRIPGTWQLNFQDSRWETSFITPKAEVSFFRRSFVDMKKNKVTQFVEELGFSGLDFTRAILPVSSIGNVLKQSSGPYFTTAISYKHCLLGDKTIDGIFKYGISPDQVFYTTELNEAGDSSFKLNYSLRTINHFLDVTFDKFSWKPQYQFLSPFFSMEGGSLDGKLEGHWTEDWQTGEWLGNINLIDFNNDQGKIPDLLHKTLALFDLSPKDVKSEGLKFSVKNNLINLNPFALENGDSGKIAGNLSSSEKGRSILTLSYPKKKKIKPVKKEVIEKYWMNKEEI